MFVKELCSKAVREVRAASWTELINALLARAGDGDSEFAITAGRRSINNITNGEEW